MNRTLWCGNLSDGVTQELLYELFLQAAPIERVTVVLPSDKQNSRQTKFAFIVLKHEVSVNYTIRLLNGTRLFGKPILVKLRNSEKKQQSVSVPNSVPNMFSGCSTQMLRMVKTKNPYNELPENYERHNDYQYRGGGGVRRYERKSAHNNCYQQDQNRRNYTFITTHPIDRKQYNAQWYQERKRNRQ